MKIKKIILSLGLSALTLSPVAMVVSCGNNKINEKTDTSNYNNSVIQFIKFGEQNKFASDNLGKYASLYKKETYSLLDSIVTQQEFATNFTNNLQYSVDPASKPFFDNAYGESLIAATKNTISTNTSSTPGYALAEASFVQKIVVQVYKERAELSKEFPGANLEAFVGRLSDAVLMDHSFSYDDITMEIDTEISYLFKGGGQLADARLINVFANMDFTRPMKASVVFKRAQDMMSQYPNHYVSDAYINFGNLIPNYSSDEIIYRTGNIISSTKLDSVFNGWQLNTSN